MGDLFIDGKENHKWNSNMNFLLAMIGSAVGLGNIWRFPYVAYTNGGGAIILPTSYPFLHWEYQCCSLNTEQDINSSQVSAAYSGRLIRSMNTSDGSC